MGFFYQFTTNVAYETQLRTKNYILVTIYITFSSVITQHIKIPSTAKLPFTKYIPIAHPQPIHFLCVIFFYFKCKSKGFIMKMKNKNSIKQIALQRILNQKIRQSGIKHFFSSLFLSYLRGMKYYILFYTYTYIHFFLFDANVTKILFRKVSPIFSH